MSDNENEKSVTRDPGDSGAAEASEESTSPFPSWRVVVTSRWAMIAVLAVSFGLVALSPPSRELLARYRAQIWASTAVERLERDDRDGALEAINKALDWLPDSPQLLLQRADILTEQQKLQEALADVNRALEAAPQYSRALSQRATLYYRLDRHDEAIADLDRTVELWPEGEQTPLNLRAYLFALMNVRLEDALADIDRAIELARQPGAELLDTRGYLLLKLGRPNEALDDLNNAIDQAEQDVQSNRKSKQFKQLPEAVRKRRNRLYDEMLAVLYHHRGEAYEALEEPEKAESDLARADELGYDPSRGVE